MKGKSIFRFLCCRFTRSSKPLKFNCEAKTKLISRFILYIIIFAALAASSCKTCKCPAYTATEQNSKEIKS